MASLQHLPTMEKLPNDILSNIFIRLLAKQLAQMRCVSKTWNDLLSRPSFVKSHLDRSLHKNDGILLVFYQLFSFNSKPFTAHPSQSPHIELTNFIKLPKNLQSEHTSKHTETGADVIGSINGLICFKYGPYIDADYYIWNPSLSALLTLPPSDMPDYDSYDLDFIFLRFGYDPKTDDYKLVKLTSLVQQPNMVPPILTEWFVEVYSMRKGFFKLITQTPPSHIKRIRYSNHEVCADGHDGHLHWFGYTDSGHYPVVILAFDLSAETFYELPIPDFLLDDKLYFNICLGVSVGKLCVMANSICGKCEVWVMNEYGVADSWIKHHVFSYHGVNPFGFTLRNEFLFDVYGYRLSLYDPISAKVKTFKIKSRKFGQTKIVEYVDSLVWVAPTKRKKLSRCMSRLKI